MKNINVNNLPVFPSCLQFSSLVSEDGSVLTLDILPTSLKVKAKNKLITICLATPYSSLFLFDGIKS